MDLNELPGLLKQLQDRSQEHAALKSLLSELGQALADLLAHNEKSAPALAKAIADALKGVRMESPTVNVTPTINVAPTPVQVAAPVVNVAAPEVTVKPTIKVENQKQAVKRITFNWAAGDVLTGMDLHY